MTRIHLLLGLVVGGCAAAPRIDLAQLQDPQGKLQRATDEATRPSSGSGSPSSSRTAPRYGPAGFDNEDESFLEALLGPFFEGFGEEVLGPVIKYTVGLPWTVPVLAMEPPGLYWSSGYYLDHPYQEGEPFVAPMLPRRVVRDLFSYRVQAEVGSDFDRIERYGLSARIETKARIGLDASWVQFREDLGPGLEDRLDLGDANLTFRFAQAGYGEMRTGLGAAWLVDSGVREGGLNFTYSGDFYPIDPAVLSFELDLGRVGSANRVHARATLGATWEGVELTAGYDHERVGGVDLPTWVVGLRLWF